MKDIKDFINRNIQEVSTFTVDEVNFYKTRSELVEAIKKDEIKRIIKSALSKTFDFDESFYIEKITNELMKKIDEIIEICNAKEV